MNTVPQEDLRQASTATNGLSPKTRRLQRLSVSEAPFASTGIATVLVTRDGVQELLELPIKSVDVDDVRRLAPAEPVAPTVRDFDKKSRRWITIVDEANADYQRAIAQHQRVCGEIWFLMALDIDVLDAADKVVWSADNTVHNHVEAMAALKAMGFVDNHFVDALRAVRALTSTAVEKTDED